MADKFILKRRHQSQKSVLNFRNIALSIIGLICIAWLAVWIFRVVQNIGQPQIEYSEGYMVYISRLFGLRQWQWDITQLDGSQMVAFYPPVFYWILGHVMQIFGYSLLVGRVFELIVFLLCLLMVFLIVRHFVKSILIASIACLLPLTQPFVNTWSLFVRVDFLSILFELVGLYLAIKFWKSWWFFATLPLFILAFFTKQSTVAGALAVIIYIAINNWRFAVIYLAFYVLGIGGILVIGSILTNGQFFREIILYQRLIPQFRPLSEAQGFLSVAYLEMLPLLLLTFWYLVKNYFKPLLLPFIFSGAAILASIILITRPGGSQNYFFETTLAMSITAGMSIPEIIKQKSKITVASFGILVLFLIFSSRSTHYPGPVYAADYKKAAAIIKNANYPILTENADVVTAAGKIPYNEPFVFGNLAKSGYWDTINLSADIKSGHLEYVITQYRLDDGQRPAWRIEAKEQAEILNNFHVVLNCEDKDGYGFIVYKNNKKRGD